MISTTLTWTQLDLAVNVGATRSIRALAAGRKPAHGAEKRGAGWNISILGAIGECGVARILGVFWEASTDPDYVGDVSPGIHVRATERRDGSLILHDSDPDEGVFYLALVDGRTVTLGGGIIPRYGKVPENWRDDVPEPGFFVPQTKLTMPAWHDPEEEGKADG